MKVLFVVPSYEPAWAFGGTVTATSGLCKTLPKKGADVTILTTDADGKGGHLDVPLGKPLNLADVKVWYFHCDFLPKKAFYSKGLSQKIKETVKYFDLVHVSAIWQWHQRTVFKECTKSHIPYIVSPHSSLMNWSFKEVGNRWLKSFYWGLFGNVSINKATAIHFLSHGEREVSRDFAHNSSSFIVPNGINLDDFRFDRTMRNELRGTLGLPESAKVILFLGRIHPKKNIELIVRAISENKNKTGKVFFLVVGYVENQKYYRSLRKLVTEYGLNSRVKWVPPIENKEVKNFYLMSDLMVLPSKSEGVSMAINEALATSLPVLISNRVANHREIEKDRAGIIVEPEQTSVTKALKMIMSSPSILKNLSLNARKSAENRYDINKVASLMIKAYEDVLTGRRSPELQWQ